MSRGDIEDIRGVTVSPNIIRTLEQRGWLAVVGHREVPGRPALYATTKDFLNDLGLRSLPELPPLEEIARTLDLNEASIKEEATAESAAREPGDNASAASAEEA